MTPRGKAPQRGKQVQLHPHIRLPVETLSIPRFGDSPVPSDRFLWSWLYVSGFQLLVQIREPPPGRQTARNRATMRQRPMTTSYLLQNKNIHKPRYQVQASLYKTPVHPGRNLGRAL